MNRRITALRRLAAAALVALAAAAAASAAGSPVYEAYKHAKELREDAARAKSPAERAAAERRAADEARKSAASFAAARERLGRADLTWLGLLHGLGGDRVRAAATLRDALRAQGTAEEDAAARGHLVRVLLEGEELAAAAKEASALRDAHPSAEETRAAARGVGLAHRATSRFAEAAAWLRAAADAGDESSVEPLVGALLLAGDRDGARAAAKAAVGRATPQSKEWLESIAALAGRAGESAGDLLAADVFVPAGGALPEDKVLVVAFWRAGSRSLSWIVPTLERLQRDHDGKVAGVVAGVCAGRDPATGRPDASLDAAAERTAGEKHVRAAGWTGAVATVRDEAALRRWGFTGQPFVAVVARDRTLRFAFRADPSGETDARLLAAVVREAVR